MHGTLFSILLIDFIHLDPVVLTVDVLSSQKHDLYGFKPRKKCVRKWVPCGDELTRTQQITTLASLSLVLINNATHLYAKREISEPGTDLSEQKYSRQPYVLFQFTSFLLVEFQSGCE